jgi:hypothetical protein
MTFTQLTASLKNFLMGWLLVLGLKESQVECAIVCVKREVILIYVYYEYYRVLLTYYLHKKKCRFRTPHS